MTFDPAAKANATATRQRPPHRKRSTAADKSPPTTNEASQPIAVAPSTGDGDDAGAAPHDVRQAAPEQGPRECEIVARVRIVEGRELRGYAGHRISEISSLRPREAGIVNIILGNLGADHVRCQKGRGYHPAGSVVEARPDIVRVLLNQLADDYERQTGRKIESDFGFDFR